MRVLKLLGGASLESADVVRGGPALQRHRIALLALLAVRHPRAVPRETLMGLLWPERDPDQVRRLLNQSIYVLRRLLGDGAILSVGDALRLQPGMLRCDVAEFEQAVAAGELQRALDLYTGPFLDGFFLDGSVELERWLEEQRTRLAEVFASVLRQLGDSAEGCGDFQAAQSWRKRLVAHDPFDSRAVLHLMRACEAAGDRAAALRHAAAHERVLQEELGVGLGPEITQAVDALRQVRMSPTPRPGPRDLLAQPTVRAGAPSAAVPDSVQDPPRRHARARRGSGAQTAFGAALLVLVAAVLLMNRFGGVHLPSPATQVDTMPMRSPQQRTASIAAYELYRKGSDPAALRDDAAARRALADLRQAVALDPSYAAAWAALARLALRAGVDSEPGTGQEDAYQFALDAARRAVDLDGSLADGHATLGVLRMHRFDFAAADASLTRAVTLDPAFSLAREWRATLYLWMARPAEALAEAELAAGLDPLSATAQAEVARALAANGRCVEALARLNRLERVEPALLRVPVISAQCKSELGMSDEAIVELRSVGRTDLTRALLGFLLARAGSRDEALRILDALLEDWHRGQGGALPIAVVQAGLGDLDQAVTWLEGSLQDGSLEATNDHFTVLQPLLSAFDQDPRLRQFPQIAPLAAHRVRQRDAGGR